ncbi:type II toxin-antitoxin system RelB/DinJ family antitoxin [Candidatus Gracilibacteria bacterium]|nr:type II toxin-antitoxin system RelB/DinJ family antitoxin [Candidatus Gracilibacteria bacterium]
MGHIQIRISDSEKEQVQEVLNSMGLTYSSAIKLFLRKIIQDQKLPFQIAAKQALRPKKSKQESVVSTPKPTSPWNPFQKRKIGL